MEGWQNSSKIDLVRLVTSENDTSLKQKPYARLKEEYAFNSDKTDAKDYLVRSCKNRGIWPIEILLEQFDEKELVEAIDYITDNGDRAKFDPPRTMSELQTEKCAYFAGVAAGDGGFNGPKTWSVVDGGKEHQLEYSREFIEEISQIMQDLFGLEEKSIWINKKDNRVELKITNKWFSRYIRHVFGLPKSYKKGKLSRPDIFQSQENIAAYWRGVFDTDGSVSSTSYRVSMGTATESFANECLEDLTSIGLSVGLRSSANGYEIRVDTIDFEDYCKCIGFSHPRKREMILSKLQEGSRNYVYEGRSNEILNNMYYDLTKLEGLRVIGLGDQIRLFREEESIYQKGLADQIGVSTNQIWCWENEESAAPINKMKMIFGSTRELLDLFAKKDVEFKMGVRGNKNSPVKLPIKTASEIDNVASKVVSTKSELRIANMDENVASEIEEKFCTDVRKEEHKLSITNEAVVNFFSKFYLYEPTFPFYDLKDIKRMRKRLKIL